jgi:glycosyltransferase involved in cell wall biosynthesis
MLRVGIFCRRSPDAPGGVEYVVRALAVELTRQIPDWDVRVEPAFLAPGGLERIPVLGDLLASLKLGWRLIGSKYQVVFIQGAEYAWGCRLFRWISRGKSALAVVWHGVGYLEAGVSRPPGNLALKVYAAFRRFEQGFGLKADAIMAVHQRVVRDLATVYGFSGSIDVAMNAIGADVRNELATRGVEATGFVILWIGQAAYQKGLDVAIRACAIARETIPDLRLIAVGTELDRQTDAWITSLGRRAPSEVKELFRSAQLLLYPSRYEGFGITLLEAMAAGLPIVASAAAAQGTIENGIHGKILAGFDPASYADAIVDLWRDPGLRTKMSRRNQEDVSQFSWPNTAACYAAVAVRLRGIEDGVGRKETK